MQRGKCPAVGFGSPMLLALSACAFAWALPFRPSGRTYGRAQWEAARPAGPNTRSSNPLSLGHPFGSGFPSLVQSVGEPAMRRTIPYAHMNNRIQLSLLIGGAA